MKASLIITSFNRPQLLKFGLESLHKYPLNDIEIIVLNDGDSDDGTEEVCKSFGVRYFAASQDKERWRIPGFAINFGVKQSLGEYVFISCAEIYHMGDSLSNMISVLNMAPNSLVIPKDGRDDDGKLLAKLVAGQTISNDDFDHAPVLHNTHLPFFMGMKKENFVNIGGYDEDFTGIAYDDNDFVERMNRAGYRHVRSSARIVHLYHPRMSFGDPVLQAKFDTNLKLYKSRQNVILRNVNRVWGEKF